MRKRKLNTQDIVDKIIIYDLLGEFSSTKEMLKTINPNDYPIENNDGLPKICNYIIPYNYKDYVL